jgi:hypothetical protein
MSVPLRLKAEKEWRRSGSMFKLNICGGSLNVLDGEVVQGGFQIHCFSHENPLLGHSTPSSNQERYRGSINTKSFQKLLYSPMDSLPKSACAIAKTRSGLASAGTGGPQGNTPVLWIFRARLPT